MTKLARSAPGFDLLTPPEGSAVLDDIQVVRWNLERNSINANHIQARSITSEKIVANAITAEHIAADSVGARAIIADSITSRAIAAEAITADKIAANAITADKISVSQLSAISADLGTITAGSIGVTGSVTIGGNVSIGGVLGNNFVQTFYQASAPTGGTYHVGDLWVNSDTLRTFRWNGSNWTSQSVSTNTTTFAQDSIPTSLAEGDLWVDTNDGNKLYRAASAGANEVAAGEWVAVMDAINAGGYVTVDSNNNITSISTAGITVATASSGARTQMDADGIKIFDSGGTARTYLTAGDGLEIRCASDTPGNSEVLTIAGATGVVKANLWYNPTLERVILYADDADASPDNILDLWLAADKGNAYLYAMGAGIGVTDIYAADDVEITADHQILLMADNGFVFDTGTNIDAYYFKQLGTTVAYTDTAGNFSFKKGWTDWTPTVTASGSMTISSLSITRAKYQVHGSVLHFVIGMTFTTGGTASTDVIFTLPGGYTMSTSQGQGYGHFVDGSTTDVLRSNYQSSTSIWVKKRDGSNWGLGTSRAIYITGFVAV
jgi:hypothetical protein